MITGHNYQFLAASRAMQGHQADTIAAGRKWRAAVPDEILTGCPTRLVWVVFYLGMIRFGMWDAILAEPTPDPKLRGLTGGYTYAKTVALAAKGRTDEAKASLVDLERIANAAGPRRYHRVERGQTPRYAPTTKKCGSVRTWN
jgi:hypothetical protein